MGQREAAKLFHAFLHKVADVRRNPEIFEKSLKWIFDFLEKEFNLTYWLTLVDGNNTFIYFTKIRIFTGDLIILQVINKACIYKGGGYKITSLRPYSL